MDPWYRLRLRKYKTQTGYMSPYYLSKAYITNNIIEESKLISENMLPNVIHTRFGFDLHVEKSEKRELLQI